MKAIILLTTNPGIQERRGTLGSDLKGDFELGLWGRIGLALVFRTVRTGSIPLVYLVWLGFKLIGL